MKISLRLAGGILLFSLLLAACASGQTPSPTGASQPAISTLVPSVQTTLTPIPPTPAPTEMATVTALPPSPTPTVAEPPPPPPPPAVVPTLDPNPLRFTAGSMITFTSVKMNTASNGWGIGRTAKNLNDHILRTADGGLTWRDVNPPQTLLTTEPGLAAVGAFRGSRAWVVFTIRYPPAPSDLSVVWRTVDGGLTWLPSANLPTDLGEYWMADAPVFLDDQHGWLLAHVGAGMMHDYVNLYATQDGGATWTMIASPSTDNFPQSFPKTGLVFADSKFGWLTGDAGGVSPDLFFYATADSGLTWNQIALPAPAAVPNLFTNQDNVCGTYQPGFFSPQSGSVVVRCNNFNLSQKSAWLYRTTDAGKNWTSTPLPASEGDLQWISETTGFYLAGGKFYQTTDAGQKWNVQSEVSWAGSIDFIDPQTGWVAAKDSSDHTALVTSVNSGIKWTELKPLVVP